MGDIRPGSRINAKSQYDPLEWRFSVLCRFLSQQTDRQPPPLSGPTWRCLCRAYRESYSPRGFPSAPAGHFRSAHTPPVRYWTSRSSRHTCSRVRSWCKGCTATGTLAGTCRRRLCTMWIPRGSACWHCPVPESPSCCRDQRESNQMDGGPPPWPCVQPGRPSTNWLSCTLYPAQLYVETSWQFVVLTVYLRLFCYRPPRYLASPISLPPIPTPSYMFSQTLPLR